MSNITVGVQLSLTPKHNRPLAGSTAINLTTCLITSGPQMVFQVVFWGVVNCFSSCEA